MSSAQRRRPGDRFRHLLLGAAAVASPALTAVAFFFWLGLGPRYVFDRECGISDTTAAVSVLLFALPTFLVAAWARWRHRRLGRAIVLVAATLALTAVAFFVAFAFWFGVNRCGE